MIRRTSLTALLLFVIAAPLSAQVQMRVDRSTSASDPDDVPDVTIESVDGGLIVRTGPAAVIWRDQNTTEGSFTLAADFTLLEPSSHANYYGFMYGGRDLQGSSQNYLYFLIAQNGTYIVKHRANDETVHDIVGRTRHDAINTPGDDGQSTNRLEVRVGADGTDFVINGTVVHTAARSGMAGRSDGLWGFRINHVIPGVRIDNISPMQ